MIKSIHTVLAANRGEIARRVFRTCRSLGIRTVAVFSDADAGAPFVQEADVAVRLPGSASAETYLNADAILDAAARTGADAIHPGYGFLAENAEFAEACAARGVTFIGPPPAAIRAMGQKREAKALAVKAGVPVVPGSEGAVDDAALAKAADAVGYPVLLKASAGGGGKGMRIVRAAAELPEAIAAAKRESKAAFGDDALLLEKYIERPRHVEIQIFGDAHGNVVHLFERECSIQRRYQKIVEEAPSTALSPELRAAMGDAAVRLAKAIGYVNAGTVEFVLGPAGDFHFLEVNTRLQVEHPVTECVTGLDLVREQIRVAEGHPLSFTQEQLKLDGASIEVRLYAEDPGAGHLPQTGVIHDFHLPARDGVRVDSGVEAGSDVGIHYDPMLAKIVGFGPDRESARRRLVAALRELSISGVRTNRDLLLRTLDDQAFVAGDLDTHFLERRFGVELVAPPTDGALALAALAATLRSHAERAARAPVPTVTPRFRNNPFADECTAYRVGDREVTTHHRVLRDGSLHVVVRGGADGDAQTLVVSNLEVSERDVSFEANGVRRAARVTRADDATTVLVDGVLATFDESPRFPERRVAAQEGGYAAPMPGKVTDVRVKVGQAVRQGETLLVLEAMKMEHPIKAHSDGTVEALLAPPGTQVDPGTILIVVQ
ncbi:MAG: ATP-grasp domain-containing protein [Myxococcales bacterium]|nr:ATP-grasp domain-containing protein [Myxococcales bacterium]